MPNIYNVQANSPIKVPENKCCVTCGQPIFAPVQPMSNHMNNYLNPISGNIVTVNSNENVLVIQGTKLYKVDGKNDKNENTSSFIESPATAPKEESKVSAPSK